MQPEARSACRRGLGCRASATLARGAAALLAPRAGCVMLPVPLPSAIPALRSQRVPWSMNVYRQRVAFLTGMYISPVLQTPDAPGVIRAV